MSRAPWIIMVALVAGASACGDDASVAPTGSTTAGSGGGAATTGSGAGSTAASGGASSSGTGGAGGAGGMGTGGMAAGGASAGGGGLGGAWPQPLALVSEGLLARYHIDEAAMGTVPTELVDSAPNPNNLALSYEGELSYSEVSGHRGLSWSLIEQNSRASIALAGSKFTGLQAENSATIEMVLELSAVSSSHTRLSHIGEGSDSGNFTLSAPSITRAQLYTSPGGRIGMWQVDFVSLGRVVMHAVLDTAQADPEMRQRLYVNGAPAIRVGGDPIAQDAVIDVGTTTHYVLGNRETGGRSGVGTIYYAAIYTDVLTDAEIVNNAAALLFDDDTPAP
jgi:hypothetical protein